MNQKKLIPIWGLILACLLLWCCQRTNQTIRPEFSLNIEAQKGRNSIPLEYGNLIGVTSAGPGFAKLWFEKSDKTIVVAGVNIPKGYVESTVLVIPRK